MKKNKHDEHVLSILQKYKRSLDENLSLINNNVFSKKQLAYIWSTLQDWNWADSLGICPEKWEELPNYDKKNADSNNTKYYHIYPYIKYIENKIGVKETLKFHHIYNLGRNIFQFYWWYYTQYTSLFASYKIRNYL